VTRILHLSDLHFGAVDDRLLGPVLDLAARLAPDAVVISGDLTQRARRAQFAAARAFVDRLPQPVLVVPGNHDMPLGNLALRLLAPLRNYARAFGQVTEPRLDLPGAVLQGVNTADPLVWKAGRLTAASGDRLAAAFAGAAPGVFRIAVLHHAPVPAADGTPADIARPAAALARLARAGADIVLSGHTHMPHSGWAETAAGVLFLQVGTAISTRRKTDANDLALIELAPGRVTRRSWAARAGERFAEAPPVRFLHTPAGWQEVAGA
jgi:3',5'-cyclic AMP phosphodiesterase CpdA